VIILRNLAEDQETVSMIRKRSGAALWKLKVKGMIAEVAQQGEHKGWRLA